MTPSQIRAELLGQHRELRILMAEVRAVAALARSGEASGATLHAAFVRLADELRRHNSREEALLKDIIPTVDPWGETRAQIMSQEHLEEHRELYGELLAQLTSIPSEVAGVVDRLLDGLLAHMRREEESFLGEDVLRDDPIVVDVGG